MFLGNCFLNFQLAFYFLIYAMANKVSSLSVVGLNVKPVRVEIDLDPGLHNFRIVGLADKAVEESRERVGAAVKASGAKPPQRFNRKIIVNLAPADLKKQGPAFDLPIAVAFLIASDQINFKARPDLVFAGELALDGSLCSVQGVLAMAIYAQRHDLILVIPKENKAEASLVKDLKIIASDSLKDLVLKLEKNTAAAVEVGDGIPKNFAGVLKSDFDMGFIRGQEQAKRALEIAAAGGHHILLHGSPGSGKTILSRAMPTILPPMSEDETLEVTKIWSVAGLLHAERPLILERPFRTPHHSASLVSIIGGGTSPRPGEISLAHRGVLFLDEFPEFPRSILEALRQPLEDGEVTVARAKETVLFPARFSLVAAQNPCPCGNLGDQEVPCVCSSGDIMKYKRKISGPILDRIDINVSVPRVSFEKLRGSDSESSQDIRLRVIVARKLQEERFSASKIHTNAEMSTRQINSFCKLNRESEQILKRAHDKFHLSPRGHNRILKVARTISDLAGEENIGPGHIAEAVHYRHNDTD